jgi:hypothetical protein
MHILLLPTAYKKKLCRGVAPILQYKAIKIYIGKDMDTNFGTLKTALSGVSCSALYMEPKGRAIYALRCPGKKERSFSCFKSDLI